MSAIDLAREARAVLENEAFKHACSQIEQKCFYLWRGSYPNDTAERETAYQLIQALDHLKTELQIILDNGEIAAQRQEK